MSELGVVAIVWVVSIVLTGFASVVLCLIRGDAMPTRHDVREIVVWAMCFGPFATVAILSIIVELLLTKR